MEEEIEKTRDDMEMKLITVRRALLNELRGEYESVIRKTPPALLKLPVMALKSAGRKSVARKAETGLAGIANRGGPVPGYLRSISGRKVIREASVIAQSMILEEEDVHPPPLQKGTLGRKRPLRPSFAISIKDNSILIDKVDIHSKGPDVVGNIIKDIQKVLKRHYKS